MEKEDNGPSGASMTEADFQYLRNINTRPGPNAGRSIDSTKPGPDLQDDSSLPSRVSPGPQDVREAVANVLRRYGIAKSSAEHVATQVLAALAQSDAEPVGWYIDEGRGWFPVTKEAFNHLPEHYRRACLFTASPRSDASGLIEAATPDDVSEAATHIANRAADDFGLSADEITDLHGICQEEIEKLRAYAIMSEAEIERLRHVSCEHRDRADNTEADLAAERQRREDCEAALKPYADGTYGLFDNRAARAYFARYEGKP